MLIPSAKLELFKIHTICFASSLDSKSWSSRKAGECEPSACGTNEFEACECGANEFEVCEFGTNECGAGECTSILGKEGLDDLDDDTDLGVERPGILVLWESFSFQTNFLNFFIDICKSVDTKVKLRCITDENSFKNQCANNFECHKIIL